MFQMLQSEKRQHKEGEMFRNLDLLGMTWSFVPVPKVTFWVLPKSHNSAGLYKMPSYLLQFSFQ